MRIKPVQLAPVAEAPPSPEPGVYYDLDDGLYNSWKDAFRSSWAKRLIEATPAHLRWEIDHPKDPTEEQILGRIVHVAVLEPGRFEREFVRGPDVNRNTKEGKELWKQAVADNPGKTVLRYHHYITAEMIRESVWDNPIHKHIRDALLVCEDREVTIIWIDKATGVKCRARIDALDRAVGVMLDLKTTTCAKPEVFERSIADYGYDIQAALYQRACTEAGWDIHDSHIIALEKEPPFLCSKVELTHPVLQEGDRRLSEALAIFAKCQRSGVWTGYPENTVPVSYPDWFWRRLQRPSFTY